MVREDLKTRRTKKATLLGFFLINIIPIGGLGALIWGLNTGRVSLDDLPGGLGRNALYFGVSIALLVITASLLLPLVHGCARYFLRRLMESAMARREGGALRGLWEGLLWLPRQVFYRVAGLLRLILVILSFALILCAVIFMIRFVNPEFLEDKVQVSQRMEQVESWLSNYRR